MVKEDKTTWKANYFLKLAQLFEEYSKIFLVGVDYVGSKQMQNIRISMRGKAVLLLGKNTMMRKVIRGQLDRMPQLEKLLPLIKGNVGFVFTNLDLTETRDLILSNRVPAAAKAGVVAPLDVDVPAQVTPLGPEKTSFFQALQIQTKISRGNIEILNSVHLVTAGERVGASESALLGMLGITPFSYGLEIEKVYDSGTVFDPKILDITDDDLRATFMAGVRNLASVCLAVGYPTVASVPHSIANGFKNLMAVAAVTDITFKEVETLKEYLADPSKFAAAAPAAAPVEEKKKEEAKKEESEEESDEDMGFGLFD